MRRSKFMVSGWVVIAALLLCIAMAIHARNTVERDCGRDWQPPLKRAPNKGV